MSDSINRRDFFRRSGRGAVGAAAGAAVIASAGVANAASTRLGRKAGSKVAEIPSLCEMCFWRCGILGQVDESGELVGVRGNPDHPMSRGHLCARGNAGYLLHKDPDRLTHPLIRTGERGAGEFRRASWDEALDLIATRMLAIRKEHGASAMALAPHGMSAFMIKSLFRHFGSAATSVASYGQCRGPRITAFKHTFGTDIGSPERLDFEHTKLIVLIGSHIGENVHTSQVHEFADALARGAKLVVVDPRFSVAASKADEYLPIKPGTDMALLLAWLHVIIAENGYDTDYVARYTTGIDELREHVKSCTPEWAAKLTDIPAEQIVRTARMMAEAHPAVIVHPGRQVTWYGDDHQRERALAILIATLGAWGRRGGMFLPSKIALGRFECKTRLTPEDEVSPPEELFPVAEEGVPAQVLVDAMLTGKPRPIKGLMIYGTNILASWPQPDRTREALKKLDFIVAVDVMPTDPVLWADVVLPEASYLERYDIPLKVRHAKRAFVGLRQPIVAPPGEAKGPFFIARELSLRLGLDACLPCSDEEALLGKVLEPLGLDLGELKLSGFEIAKPQQIYIPEGGAFRFRTPTGRIEIYSHDLAEKGVDPLPGYTALPEPAPGSFRLLYGRSPTHSFARSQNNSMLCEIDPVNQLWINDEVAAELGIANGDAIEIVRDQDHVSLPLPAKVTPGIRKDCVFMVHGFGSRSHLQRRAFKRGASDGELMIDIAADKDTGATGMRANFVTVQRASQPASWPEPLASTRPQREGAKS